MRKQVKPKATWEQRAIAATRGNSTQFGAIILACVDTKYRDEWRTVAPTHPAFAACASVTSDGYIMAGFIDRNGEGHSGAFVGDFRDYKTNVLGLAEHLKLKGEDRDAYLKAMRDWIRTDYRANPETF